MQASACYRSKQPQQKQQQWTTGRRWRVKSKKNFTKCCPWHILNYLNLLVNSANVRDKSYIFFSLSEKHHLGFISMMNVLLVPGENGPRPVHLWLDRQRLVLMPDFNCLIVYNDAVNITQIFLFALVNRDSSQFLSLFLASPSVKNTLFLINWCFFIVHHYKGCCSPLSTPISCLCPWPRRPE